MKPWLLNILACPIDKYHPLEAYFFRWETSEVDLENIAAEAGNPKKELVEKYKIVKKQLGDGIISLPAIKAISDLTGLKTISELQAKTIELLKGKPNSVKDFDVIYSYMNIPELNEGLLFWGKLLNSVRSISLGFGVMTPCRLKCSSSWLPKPAFT